MSVVEGWFAGTKIDHSPAAAELSPELLADLRVNIAMNSKAFLTEAENGRVGYVGSSTECALLLQLRNWGHDYNEVRAELEKDLIQVGGGEGEGGIWGRGWAVREVSLTPPSCSCATSL